MVCFAYAVVCVFYGMLLPAENEASQKSPNAAAPQTIREWLDASGTHHARATLLRVEGEKLWLRTADGQLATTTFAALSSKDRQYVAAYQKNLNPGRQTDTDSGKSGSGLLQQLPSLKQAAGWLQTGHSDAQPRIVPAALVYMRVSRQFLEDYVERTVQRRKPVRDYILGTRIIGESSTIGQTQLLLRPNNTKVAGEILFEGTVHSQTTGYNGPAIIHSISDATFRARKPITMGDSGLNVTPATASAPTTLQTTCIETTLPRLRGRIATRIATKRNASSHDEAEAITSQHTATRIRDDLDQRINQSVAKMQQLFKLKIPGLETDRSPGVVRMRYRSTADYVEMAMIRQEASDEELSLRPPRVDGNPDFAIRVNRSLFGSTIADSDFSQLLTPLVVKLLGARITEKAIAAVIPKSEPPANPTKWSIDHDWLAMEFTDPDRQRPSHPADSELSAE